MSGWHEIHTISELEEFSRTVSFHDGIIKEVHWVNNDSVEHDLRMRPYKLARLRILVQRQWRDPSAVEFEFENVWQLTLDTVDFVMETSARTELSPRTFGEPRTLLVLELYRSEVAFERMRWRDASEWMGADVRFGAATS